MTGKQNFPLIAGLLLCMMLGGCSRGGDRTALSGLVLLDPEPDRDGAVRILLYYDMEGISGQSDIRSLSFGNPEYDQARIWLTNDVNAVVGGLFAGGAEAVDVVDAHGSGNPEPDILVEHMDGRASLLARDESFRPYVDLTEKGVYDAVVVVCMHSRTGGGGFAAHTFTLGMDWILNGQPVNETEIIAFSWGRAGVPVIFASGDDHLRDQLAWMDWLEYVTVKTAQGAGHALLRPFEDVHAEMSAAAERAIENLAAAKAVRLTTPVKAQLHAVPPASLSVLKGVPGIDFRDQTVTFQADDFREAYDGIEALIGVATGNYMRLLQQSVRRHEAARSILRDFMETLDRIWVETESGERSAPEPSDRPSRPGGYFGVR